MGNATSSPDKPVYGSELNDALFAGQTKLALRLLAARADPHAECPLNGSQAIHFAAQAGDETAVRALLGMGVDINAKNREGHRPIDFAPVNFHAQLRSLGSDHRWGSALNDALALCDRSLVTELLRDEQEGLASIDWFARDVVTGDLCVHLAARAGFVDVLLLLVFRGVSIEEKNMLGQSVDSVAANDEVRSLITEMRASSRTQPLEAKIAAAPLSSSVSRANDLAAWRPATNKFGSKLNEALARGNEQDALFLLHSGRVDVRARSTDDGNLCTHFAVQAGLLDVLEKLVTEHGVSIDARNWHNQQVDAFSHSPEARARIAKLRAWPVRRRDELSAWTAQYPPANLQLPQPLLRLVLTYWHGF